LVVDECESGLMGFALVRHTDPLLDVGTNAKVKQVLAAAFEEVVDIPVRALFSITPDYVPSQHPTDIVNLWVFRAVAA
jgi:hypothetical protein